VKPEDVKKLSKYYYETKRFSVPRKALDKVHLTQEDGSPKNCILMKTQRLFFDKQNRPFLEGSVEKEPFE